nr:hypothetical protein [Tanacetum cinerariifolium]
YVTDSDPKEDSKDGPVDYPVDGGDDDDDDDDEEEVEVSDDEEEHECPELIQFTCMVLASLKSEANTNHVHAPRGFIAATGILRASSLSTHYPLHPLPPLPPLPSSLYLPPPVLKSSLLLSPPLPASLFIPLPVDRTEDIPKVELPPRKRLCLTAPTSRYKVEESLTAAARPTRGHRADYRFIVTLDAETRRRRAEEDSHPDSGSSYRITRGIDSDIGCIGFISMGQLSVALAQIQALQARDPTHADDPEGADSCA